MRILNKSLLAVIAAGLLTHSGYADEPAQRRRPESREGRRATEGLPGRGDGQGAKGAQRPDAVGRRQQVAGDRSPEQMIARILKEFDKDGDRKLDGKELGAFLVAMREGRAGISRPRSRPEADSSRGRRPDAGTERAGGEKPRRPDNN